jgi:hypothetical protein
MTYPEQVKALLWAEIEEMSESPWLFSKSPGSDFTRKRKMGFGDLLRFGISMESGTMRHELLKYFRYGADTISSPAFCQQRQKLLPDAFAYLLRQFNTRLPPVLYRGKYTLAACDGSEFNIARDPGDRGTFHPPSGQSKKGFNSLHAVALYDLLGKRYLDCMFQPGMRKDEFRAGCSLVDRYPYGGSPVFIADRGFASYNFYAHAIEKGALFMVRAKDINARRLMAMEGLPDSLDAWAEVIVTRSWSKKKMKRPDLAERYRRVCREASFDYALPGSDDEYALALRVVRFEAAGGVFENIVTNLPDGEFPADEIKYMYNLRWGIETSFRDLKHTIGTANFHSKKPGFVGQEILARMILFNFCSAIAARAVVKRGETKYVYQVNFAMAMKICHHFIRLRGREPPPDVEALIGSHTLPIRPGRSYARQHRFRLPASFCYRFA